MAGPSQQRARTRGKSVRATYASIKHLDRSSARQEHRAPESSLDQPRADASKVRKAENQVDHS